MAENHDLGAKKAMDFRRAMKCFSVAAVLSVLAGCGDDTSQAPDPPRGDTSVVANTDEDPFPNRSDVDVQIHQGIAHRLGEQFAGESFSIGDGRATLTITQLGAELVSSETLVIHNRFCKGAGCDAKNGATGRTLITLADLDGNGMTFRDQPGTQPVVSFACKAGKQCVENQLGDLRNHPMTWLMTCSGFQTCTEILKNLQALAWSAANPKNTAQRTPAPPPSSEDRPHGGINPSPPAGLATPLAQLSSATKDAELAVAAGGNGALRLLRGVGAYLDQENHLVVQRKACLSLINPEQPELSNCRLDSLLVDYDIHINLGRLDIERVAITQSKNWNGETGFWVVAACAAGKAYCAEMVVPENKRGTIMTVMNGLGDTAQRPNIRIPCANTTQCNKVAHALRQLARAVGPEAASGEGVLQPIVP